MKAIDAVQAVVAHEICAVLIVMETQHTEAAIGSLDRENVDPSAKQLSIVNGFCSAELCRRMQRSTQELMGRQGVIGLDNEVSSLPKMLLLQLGKLQREMITLLETNNVHQPLDEQGLRELLIERSSIEMPLPFDTESMPPEVRADLDRVIAQGQYFGKLHLAIRRSPKAENELHEFLEHALNCLQQVMTRRDVSWSERVFAAERVVAEHLAKMTAEVVKLPHFSRMLEIVNSTSPEV